MLKIWEILKRNIKNTNILSGITSSKINVMLAISATDLWPQIKPITWKEWKAYFPVTTHTSPFKLKGCNYSSTIMKNALKQLHARNDVLRNIAKRAQGVLFSNTLMHCNCRFQFIPFRNCHLDNKYMATSQLHLKKWHAPTTCFRKHHTHALQG